MNTKDPLEIQRCDFSSDVVSNLLVLPYSQILKII